MVKRNCSISSLSSVSCASYLLSQWCWSSFNQGGLAQPATALPIRCSTRFLKVCSSRSATRRVKCCFDFQPSLFTLVIKLFMSDLYPSVRHANTFFLRSSAKCCVPQGTLRAKFSSLQMQHDVSRATKQRSREAGHEHCNRMFRGNAGLALQHRICTSGHYAPGAIALNRCAFQPGCRRKPGREKQKRHAATEPGRRIWTKFKR